MLSELKSLLDEIQKSIYHEELDYLLSVITISVKKLQNETNLSHLERIAETNFRNSEEEGWNLACSDIILKYWLRFGQIMGFSDFDKKINTFGDLETNHRKKIELLEFKANKNICALDPQSDFYGSISSLMDKAIDEIILQMDKNQEIDKMLVVFDMWLEKIINCKTPDFSFVDTEDRECLSDFFGQIMAIIGFESSRGLLFEKLS